jgi:hypothetical protein
MFQVSVFCMSINSSSLFPRGWTIFDKMYIFNGTVYLVSDEPETFPDRKFMTSSGAIIENTAESVAARMPTDKDLRIISTSAARKLFGTGANRIQGVTVRVYAAYLGHPLTLPLVARQRSQAIVSTLIL